MRRDAAERREIRIPDRFHLRSLCLYGDSVRNWWIRDLSATSEWACLLYTSYVNQALVQFIDGSLDIEKDWDAYIERLESMGVDEYVAAYQRTYDAYMEAQGK